MTTKMFNRERVRPRPIKCVFRFPGREAVRCWCWTMGEVAEAFRTAKGA